MIRAVIRRHAAMAASIGAVFCGTLLAFAAYDSITLRCGAGRNGMCRFSGTSVRVFRRSELVGARAEGLLVADPVHRALVVVELTNDTRAAIVPGLNAARETAAFIQARRVSGRAFATPMSPWVWCMFSLGTLLVGVGVALAACVASGRALLRMT